MIVLWWIVFAIWLMQFGGWIYYGPIKKKWAEAHQFTFTTIILALFLNLIIIFK